MKRGHGQLKNVATAQYDFAALREKGDYVYVDKTDMQARLALEDPDVIYFIARPRRFGKSLMLSTLKCMFEGRKELFRGLKIMKSGWNWRETFPVIHLDMQSYMAPKTEQDAKRYFLLFMAMAGARMQPERASARGFADAVVETEKGVWIFEFKFNRSATSAIRQIRDRGYAESYRAQVEGGKVEGGRIYEQT